MFSLTKPTTAGKSDPKSIAVAILAGDGGAADSPPAEHNSVGRILHILRHAKHGAPGNITTKTQLIDADANRERVCPVCSFLWMICWPSEVHGQYVQLAQCPRCGCLQET